MKKLTMLFGFIFYPLVAHGASKECLDHLEHIKADWTYGSVEVPEDWSHPNDSSRLKIYYYLKKKDVQKLSQNPVAFINGGPASSSHGGQKSDKLLSQSEDLQLIFIDQRGTGCSTSLPELNNSSVRRLEKWTSRAIVQDYEAVRRHLLGTRKWKILGQSFGGLTALRYLEIAPEGLETAVIHGYGELNWDPIGSIRARDKKLAEMTERILGPSGTLGFEVLRKHFTPDICIRIGEEFRPLCGPIILDAFFVLIGFKEYEDLIRAWYDWFLIHASEKENIREAASQFFPQLIKDAANPLGEAISFIEISPRMRSTEVCAKIEWTAQIISECRFLTEVERLEIHPRNLKTLNSDPLSVLKIRDNIRSQKISVHFFSGEYDSFVPPELVQKTAQRFSGLSTYTEIKGEGHGSFATDQRVIERLK